MLKRRAWLYGMDFLNGIHYKKLHEGTDGCQWIWQIRPLAIDFPP